MAALDYFSRIYVINLPARSDRRREIGEQLAGVGLVLGEAPVELFPGVRPEAAGGFPSIGARGCFLSHLAVLRDAAERGYRRILILEDDVDFVAGFEPRMAAVAAELSRFDWDLFYGGYRLEHAPVPGGGALAMLPAALDVLTSHFVAFRHPAIARLPEFLETLLGRPAGDPRGGPMHVDGAYNWYRRYHPDDLTLAAVPELGYQRSSLTDVHRPAWFDRTPIVCDAVAGLRRWRNSHRA